MKQKNPNFAKNCKILMFKQLTSIKAICLHGLFSPWEQLYGTEILGYTET